MKENVKKENDHITRRLILEAKPIAHYLALGALWHPRKFWEVWWNSFTNSASTAASPFETL